MTRRELGGREGQVQWGLHDAMDHDIDAPEAWELYLSAPARTRPVVGCSFNMQFVYPFLASHIKFQRCSSATI